MSVPRKAEPLTHASQDATAPALPASHPQGAFAPDPARLRAFKTLVRERAGLLHATAARWRGADEALRRRVRLLLSEACRLDDSPLATCANLTELARRLDALPPALHHVAGHFEALHVLQLELDRLHAALRETSPRRHLADWEIGYARMNADGAQNWLSKVRRAIEAGRLDVVPTQLELAKGHLDQASELLVRAVLPECGNVNDPDPPRMGER
ncbi:hypothetical protein [Roseateles chitosanitabidus]|uniref:hypothetical protein n=1 Tax=Roseateles chitosanitabidus TaxID=65048 RepID=UPI000834D658|nr:hypothetical protein [Roseateles chitosanitabidus]